MNGEALTFPHMNILFYADGDTFGVDFYSDVSSAEDYEAQFAEGWQQLTRELPLRPRAHPFLFVVCPSCSTPILTNRRPDATFICKVCGEPLSVIEAPSPPLRTMRDRVLARIGKRVVGISGYLQAVIVQPVDPADREAVDSACAAAGFERVSDSSNLHAWLASEALRRGFDAQGELATWLKLAAEGQLALEGETTPAVDDLVGSLVETAPTRTISAAFDPSATDDFTLFLREGTAELEERLRDRLGHEPSNAAVLQSLVEVLLSRGSLDEAAEKARTLTVVQADAQSWRTLGRVQLTSGQVQEAAASYERALELDPLDATAMTVLAHCYRELGDERRAQLVHARASALGGPF